MPINTLLAVGFFLLGLVSVSTGAESVETIVGLSDLPPAAQKAIQAKAAGARLGKILRQTEGGENSYDVEMTKGGRTRNFTVDNAGVLLDEEVFLPETPAPVQRAIRSHLGRGELDSITKVIEDGEVTYEVEFTRQGKTRNFTLSETGSLLDMQAFLEELSAPLQDAIKKAAGVRKIGGIYRTLEDGRTYYDVEIAASHGDNTLTFDSKAALVSQSEPLVLGDAPAPVQKALRTHLAGGCKLISLDKTTEDGKVTYDAEFLKAGKRQSLTFGLDGELIPETDKGGHSSTK